MHIYGRRTVVVGVGEELDDVRVVESAEQAELLPERAQPPHLDGHGRAVPEPGQVHGAGANTAASSKPRVSLHGTPP
jgi:hypothetical protein